MPRPIECQAVRVKDGMPELIDRPVLNLEANRLVQPNPCLNSSFAIKIDLHPQLLAKLPDHAFECPAAFSHREPPLLKRITWCGT